MKLNLKNKILLLSVFANLIIAALLGGILYKYTGELYYQAFLNSKQSLARSLALAIDGDKHQSFTSLEATKNPEYQKYLKYFNTIKRQEEFITYLFTISYDRKQDKLTYIVDSDIMTTDTLWITTEYFGFALSIDDNNKINIKYNEKIYTQDFEVSIGKDRYKLKITENGTLYIGEKEFVKIVSKTPLILETGGKKLSITERELYSEIKIKNLSIPLYCSFTAKGESQSMPGELYSESKDIIQRCKQIITSQKNVIVRRDAQTSIYGINTSTVYGIIKDSKGQANGLVVIELFQKQIMDFKKSIITIIVLVSLMTFIITIIFSFLLSEYLIIPIKKLITGANEVGKGNFKYKISVTRTDEFGLLSNTFNTMVENLKKANLENQKANEELTQLKNHLELLVEERTRELKQSNSQLTTALSEVSSLKGILPVCSSCNNIRDEKGNWIQMETYIRKHSQADFTHSICPNCIRKLYPEIPSKKDPDS